MTPDIPQRYVKRLLAMTPEQQRAWMRKCRPQDLLTIDASFEAWAEAGQVAPTPEGWRVWLMMAGRGYGKTRAGAEWVHGLAMTGGKHIALVGATIDEARSIMVEGVSDAAHRAAAKPGDGRVLPCRDRRDERRLCRT